MSEDSSIGSSIEDIKTKVEFQLECGEIIAEDVKSLLTEVEIMRIQNENMKARLLEASVATGRHLQEINKLKTHLEQLTEPPLLLQPFLR